MNRIRKFVNLGDCYTISNIYFNKKGLKMIDDAIR